MKRIYNTKGESLGLNGYYGKITELILEGNHDLVIEVANNLNSLFEFYDFLDVSGYTGNYLTLNPMNPVPLKRDVKRKRGWKPTLEEYVQDSEKPVNKLIGKASNVLHRHNCKKLGYGTYMGNALSDEDLSFVIETVNPENPVYVNAGSIGIVLSYFPKDWTRGKGRLPKKNDAEYKDAIMRMADVWADNLSKTSIKHVILSDHILNNDSEEMKKFVRENGHGYDACFDHVSEDLYVHLMNRFNNYGWKSNDIIATETQGMGNRLDGAYKVLDLKR